MTPSTTNPEAPSETVIPVISEYIVKTPETCRGQPRVAGTRIKVRHIYTWVELEGMTPAQVVTEFPHLSMAAVHAALAYYWSHQEEIHRDIEAEDKLVAKLKAMASPSKLQDRSAALRDKNDSLPPG